MSKQLHATPEEATRAVEAGQTFGEAAAFIRGDPVKEQQPVLKRASAERWAFSGASTNGLWRRSLVAHPVHALLLSLLIAPVLAVRAGSDNETDEYQFNVNPYHPLTDRMDLFSNLGYYQSSDYAKYRFGLPGAIWHAETWLQLWGGLDSYYTDNHQSDDQLELRPFAGVKLFLPNEAKLQLYNFTRFEYRNFENVETGDWNGYGRIRSRFGLQVPLASRAAAWKPKSFYAMADVEPFYRFDKSEWDPVRVRGGVGIILNDRVRAELIYTAQFSRSSPGSPLEYSEGMIELNLKIALRRGILERLLNPGN